MERISRSKAIRLKCLDCCAGQMAEVRKCELVTCALWRYRMGSEENDEMNPKNKKNRVSNIGEELDCL